MTRLFDAIVVGAGPAGAAAAMELARGGAKVLVLYSGLGRSKPCGGCLSLRWQKELDLLGAPAWLYEHQMSTFWLTAPGRPAVSWTSSPGALLLERPRLDAWLARLPRQAGAEVLPEKVRGLEAGGSRVTVRTDSGSFQAGWLIGADGWAGPTRRFLGLPQPRQRFVAICEERPLPADLARRLRGAAILELAGAPGGYAWLFPRGKVANLGVGSRLALSGGQLRLAYQRFLRRCGLGEPGRLRGAVIPYPGRSLPLGQGRVLLAGDAGSLGDPFLGEGIGQAMHSGRLAAQAVLAGNARQYRRQLAPGLLREHRHAWLLANLIYGGGGLTQALAHARPGSLELGFEILRGDIAHRQLWGKVAKRLYTRLMAA